MSCLSGNGWLLAVLSAGVLVLVLVSLTVLTVLILVPTVTTVLTVLAQILLHPGVGSSLHPYTSLRPLTARD